MLVRGGACRKPPHRNRTRWDEKLAWYRAHAILPQEGGGEPETLVVTRDALNRSIDAARIMPLPRKCLDLKDRNADILAEPKRRER
jgi:hypothetical protein